MKNYVSSLVLLAVCSIYLTPQISVAEDIGYYGEEFFKDYNQLVQNKKLKSTLYFILSKYHVPQEQGYDLVKENCPKSDSCFKHAYHSYKVARQFLFGYLHLQQDGKGYFIKDVYCQNNIRGSDFSKGQKPDPWKIPDSRVINAEHTWPQSKFSSRESTALQKSDLHSLYPVSSPTNSLRSNLDFGEVDEITNQHCPLSKRGRFSESRKGELFEPPTEHKGNAARAMFYFSVRYRAAIGEELESILRTWHILDPVDLEEVERNNEVFEFQKVRNPFVDYPDMVEDIADF